MKAICISCFDHYETRMKRIIYFLKKNGYETRYIITDFNHFSKERYSADSPDSKQIHVMDYRDNISIRRLLSHYMFSKKVFKEVDNYKPDLIYCMIPPNSLAKEIGLYAKKHTNCRLIFDIYDMWPESFPKAKDNIILRMPFKYWRSLRDKYLGTADIIVTASERGVQLLKDITMTPVRVLYPTMERNEIPTYNPEIQNGFSFCYLGNINYITDLDLCEEFFGEIAKNKKVTIHHIGEGNNQFEFYDRMKKIGVEVIRHGVIFDIVKKNQIFSLCDFGINTPKKEIGSSMSLKSVEYLRAGLPFINSGIEDNEIIVDKYGVGLNIRGDNMYISINRLLVMNNDEINEMHRKCMECYDSLFINQNIDFLL